MGSVPHARGTKRHCPKFLRCVRRDFRYPFLHYPHLQIKRNLKEASLLFSNSRIPRRLYLVRRVRSRHQKTHSLSLVLYWKNFFFLLLLLCIFALFFIERTFLSLFSFSLREVNGFDYQIQTEIRSEWRFQVQSKKARQIVLLLDRWASTTALWKPATKCFIYPVYWKEERGSFRWLFLSHFIFVESYSTFSHVADLFPYRYIFFALPQ